MGDQFILSSEEKNLLYTTLSSLENQVCALETACNDLCDNAAAEACLDFDLDVVLALAGVAVGTTSYYVGTIGASAITAARMTVSIGERSPEDLSYRLVSTVDGVDSVLADSLIEAGYLHSWVDIDLIQAGSVLSLETIADVDCPPKGLKVNISGLACGEPLDDGSCDDPPLHCSVYQAGSTTHCSLFDAI